MIDGEIPYVDPALFANIDETAIAKAALRTQGGKEIASAEGTTQADPLAMPLYAVAITPLLLMIKSDEASDVRHVAYADDLSGAEKMTKIISAVGRPFGLGMLYDRRSEKLILGITLWSPDNLKAAINTRPQPFTNSEVFTENKVEDKTSALDIEASLKLSFLFGLVNVEGAAKYLNDTKTSKNQCRVVLKYETTTELKHLTMEHLGTGKIQYPEVFDTDEATDVVVGILYGAKAFMVFDKEVSKDETLKEVHGNMEVLVQSLPGLSVGGHGTVSITEEQKKNAENMRCQMYGDFRTSESPTNYEDAVKIYKQLPSLIGENGEKAVPIKVYLCPLSSIDSKCQRLVREISSSLIRKSAEIQEHLQSVIAECNDLMREDICVHFPRIGRQLKHYLKTIELYKLFLQKKILVVLPQIRGGGVDEIELAQIIEKKEVSPFSCEALTHWLGCKKQEMKRLHGLIRPLKETQVVIPEAVQDEVYNHEIQFIVCCTFKIACEEDEQILKMDAYLIDGDGSSESVAKNALKADEKLTYKKIRKALGHFTTLKSVNKENCCVEFLVTDEPLPHDYEGKTGAFIYFYEDGDIENEDLTSQPPPNNLKLEKAEESTLQISWDGQSENTVTNYKVQYQDEAGGDTWSSVDVKSSGEVRNFVTLTELKLATKYFIRICAVRKIIVSKYSEVFSASTKPASPPGKPELQEATSESLTIVFKEPQRLGKDVQIVNYKVEWSQDDWKTRKMEQTDDATPRYTLKNLHPSMSFVFRVTANCGDAGESNNSPSSDVFSTFARKPTFQPDKILGLCQLVQPPQDGEPAVYTLPLTSVFEDSVFQLRKYEINLNDGENDAPRTSIPNKVIMMVGSTGSGKTTTINAIVNYILGVEWKDSFRLKMIHEDSSKQGSESMGDQTRNRTHFVTCYTLLHSKGFKVPYNLTIVDTPGFGDTKGIQQDKMITNQIRTFFETSGDGGIDHIDAICFIAQAGIPRLTPTQRYVFDSILAMFGKDIEKNITVLFTFSDGEKPQALASLQEAGALGKEDMYFTLNNSALFADNSQRQSNFIFGSMFWTMGMKNLEKFFKCLNEMESRSLVLTKEVLQERVELEVRVCGLQNKINCGLNTLSRLQQEERIFKQHATEINDIKNFKYTVTEERRVKVPLDSGTYVTNCPTCNYTCHYPCSIPRSEDKERCAAMKKGQCRECPNHCHWSIHVNDTYRMETENVEVEKKYDGQEGKTKVEGEIERVRAEFNDTQEIVLAFVAEMQRGLKRLSEIALKKDPLQQVDYLDLLIQSEEKQGKPGFKDRVKALIETQRMAEQVNKMAKLGYDPWKNYRENENTRKYLEKENENQKDNFATRAVRLVSEKLILH
ncbi:uncharacterized protein LOC114530544 [Dendronephthya gigantea]|uniref:uncharacterized protein LOC114530544 n=1 Tax=Dendronephthya gigantea TaxID=151771 RepID=UPI00106B36DE|nr:uncharacterized protein LOC114530544 [Dendronephthya gigantea]